MLTAWSDEAIPSNSYSMFVLSCAFLEPAGEVLTLNLLKFKIIHCTSLVIVCCLVSKVISVETAYFSKDFSFT
jgi:hypothetical protein